MRLVRYTYPSFRTLAPSFGAVARSPWSGLESENGMVVLVVTGLG